VVSRVAQPLGGISIRQGQRGAVRAFASPISSGPSDLPGSAATRRRNCLHRRTRASERQGVRALCDKVQRHRRDQVAPHLLRHTFSHQYLADNQNDLVGLAQILGHENLQTISRYTRQAQEKLAEAAERLTY
jgi:integrase